MTIGTRILELRNQAKISQGQLASVMGVSRQAVSKWENDLSEPDTLRLIQLADVLNCDVEYLATGRTKNLDSSSEPQNNSQFQVKEVEKIVEIPVIKYVEKPVFCTVEKIVEKPVVRKVFRVQYVRNPIEFLLFGAITFLVGFIFGRIF